MTQAAHSNSHSIRKYQANTQFLQAFAGSGSYYGSSAETAVYVGEAHATVAPTAAPVESIADQYFVPAVVGIIVAIVVCFAITIVLLRKRP